MFRISRLTLAVVTYGLALRCGGDPLAPPPLADDPIAHEVDAWQAQIADASHTDALWTDVKPGASGALETADRALAAGRHCVALERLSSARANLAAAQYIFALPSAVRKGVPRFEIEWARMGGVLGAANAVPQAQAFADVQPAAAHALAEASAFQVKVLYDAAVLYGRATDADSGLFYLGSAQAQQQFVTFASALSPGTLQSMEPQLLAGRVDHSIGRMYLERALTELDRPEPVGMALSIAAAVADEVLPEYLAALEPAPAAPAPVAPRVTVTLVRWPFT